MKTLHLSIVLASLILLSSYEFNVNAQIENSTSSNSNCQNKILQSAVNETQAILFAVNSDQFKSAVNGSDVNFDYVYYRPSMVCEGLQSVNVLFHVKLPSHVVTLVIKEDPTISKILGVVETPVSCEGPSYGRTPATCFTGISLQQELRLLEAPMPNTTFISSTTNIPSIDDPTIHNQEPSLQILWIGIPVAIAVGISIVIFLRRKGSHK
ncbi:MAG: hypothetical protein ACREBA_08380 [Nitrosotalea sp.]